MKDTRYAEKTNFYVSEEPGGQARELRAFGFGVDQGGDDVFELTDSADDLKQQRVDVKVANKCVSYFRACMVRAYLNKNGMQKVPVVVGQAGLVKGLKESESDIYYNDVIENRLVFRDSLLQVQSDNQRYADAYFQDHAPSGLKEKMKADL